jgi:hypothetical protein
LHLVERFVLGVDIVDYSSRVAREQLVIRTALDHMVDLAAEAVGISRKLWARLDGGDGELAILPADVDLLAAVRQFISELTIQLIDHNEAHSARTQIRLRVAMHSDVVTESMGGYAGPALVVLRRLLDSQPVRQALADVPELHLAQIISESLFHRAVVPELGGLRPEQFHKVEVHIPAKKFQQTAYLYLPGDHHYTPPGRTPRPPEKPARASGFDLQVRVPVRTPPHDTTPTVTPPRTEPKPELGDELRRSLHRVRESLARDAITDADHLTTQALLTAAGRGWKGWLRTADGRRIPDELITELDGAWAEFSGGTWGFGAQRERTGQLVLSGSRPFREFSLLLGWRSADDEAASPYRAYDDFIERATYATPFYPTLRNPAGEQDLDWFEEWAATVKSVHARLQTWER